MAEVGLHVCQMRARSLRHFSRRSVTVLARTPRALRGPTWNLPPKASDLVEPRFIPQKLGRNVEDETFVNCVQRERAPWDCVQRITHAQDSPRREDSAGDVPASYVEHDGGYLADRFAGR